jgi:hypothetical protein
MKIDLLTERTFTTWESQTPDASIAQAAMKAMPNPNSTLHCSVLGPARERTQFLCKIAQGLIRQHTPFVFVTQDPFVIELTRSTSNAALLDLRQCHPNQIIFEQPCGPEHFLQSENLQIFCGSVERFFRNADIVYGCAFPAILKNGQSRGLHLLDFFHAFNRPHGFNSTPVLFAFWLQNLKRFSWQFFRSLDPISMEVLRRLSDDLLSHPPCVLKFDEVFKTPPFSFVLLPSGCGELHTTLFELIRLKVDLFAVDSWLSGKTLILDDAFRQPSRGMSTFPARARGIRCSLFLGGELNLARTAPKDDNAEAASLFANCTRRLSMY